MKIKQQDLDAALAEVRAQAQATGKTVSTTVLGHRVMVIPALDGRGLTMDERKREFRSIV